MTNFNPFKYIFILEGFSEDHTIYDKEKLILIMDFIEANKATPGCISLIDKEIKKIGTITRDVTTTEPLQSNSSGSSSTDIKERINNTITSLKKMCNSENMMEIFMELIYLIEKPHVAK